MKEIRIHRDVIRELKRTTSVLSERLAVLLDLLAKGERLGLPSSRPMPVIGSGAHELRVRDRRGNWRVFYFTKKNDALLVFHAFKKKTQKTPKREIETARSRLKEMLS